MLSLAGLQLPPSSESDSVTDAPLVDDDRPRFFTTESHRNREQALWRSVIYRALEDALGEGLHGSPIERQRQRDEARDWLTGMSRDFIETCALADMEPEQVRRQALGVLRRAGLV